MTMSVVWPGMNRESVPEHRGVIWLGDKSRGSVQPRNVLQQDNGQRASPEGPRCVRKAPEDRYNIRRSDKELKHKREH